MKTRSMLLYGALLLALVVGMSFMPTDRADASKARQVSAGAVSDAAAQDTVIAYARPGRYFAAIQLTTSAVDTFLTEPAMCKVFISMNGSEWDSVATLADTVTALAAPTTVSTENEYITIPFAPIVKFTVPGSGVVCDADSVIMYPLLLEVEQ